MVIKHVLFVKSSIKTLRIFIFCGICFTGNLSSQVYEWSNNIDVLSNPSIGLSTGRDLDLDLDGNLLCVGLFKGVCDFDPDTSIFSMNSKGGNDGYLAKYNNNGDLLWAFQLGSSNDDGIFSVKADKKGNIFVSGYFTDTVDFDPSLSVYNLYSNIPGTSSSFLAKYDSIGNLNWAHSFHIGGGASNTYIGLDGWGNIYYAGNLMSAADFDPSPATYVLSPTSSKNAFLAKFNTSGNISWAFAIKSQNAGISNFEGLAIGELGDAYLTGSFDQIAEFNPKSSSDNKTSHGQKDIFIAKYDSLGDHVWSMGIGSNGLDIGRRIALDNNENVYCGGSFESVVDFNVGIDTNYLIALNNGVTFLLSCDKNGNFLWAKNFGKGATFGNPIVIWGMDVDMDGAVYLTGSYGSLSDFDPSPKKKTLPLFGSSDFFIAKFDSSQSLDWARGMGVAGLDAGHSIVTDLNKNIYVTGTFNGGWMDFNPGWGVSFLYTSPPSSFIAKYANCFIPVVNDSVSICYGEKYMLPNGKYTSKSVIDTSTILSFFGCDSTIVTQLEVKQVNPNVTQSNNKLIATIGNAGYQWLTCDTNGYSVITGATSQVLEVKKNGSYAVVVDFEGCTDTSNCIELNTIGIVKNDFGSNLSFYPNPTSSLINIEFEKEFHEMEVEIIDITGNIIFQNKYHLTTSIHILIENEPGLYFVRITSSNGNSASFKVLKE